MDRQVKWTASAWNDLEQIAQYIVHGQWLRVTFRDEAERRIVITVTPKQKFAGGANAH
jgi:plasmid stabilization system protein ParE